MKIKLPFLLLVLLLLCSCSNDDNNSTNTLPDELNFTGPTLGCGDFVVAKLLDDENLNISLSVSGGGRENLNITNEVQSFLLPNENLNVVIQIWDIVNDNFCSDISPAIDPVLISTWSVVSGRAEVSASNIPDDSYSTEYNFARKCSL